jgi:hypothetical protein
MAAPAPSDLAVAFRSFARRLHEALGDIDEDPDALAAAGPSVQALDDLVRRVASSLRVSTGGDLAEVGERVAERVEHRPADEWTDAELHDLEATALDAGRLLRPIGAAAGND